MAKGFSLIELLATLSIVSITAMIGLPITNKFVEKQKVTADVYTMIRMVNLTRSEAIKSKQTVSLCGLTTNNDCQRDWQQVGVINQEQLKSSASEPLHQARVTANYSSIKWSSFQRSAKLSFGASGFSMHLNGSLYLCHAKYPELNKAIKISKSGKASVISADKFSADRCS
ncbi:MAG: GspH/FimT family pseudopilin [Gammaproteobacteria bacterium]|nr:GspH/FimT family pseudopilin [Gammaproteobacteria bacterium]